MYGFNKTMLKGAVNPLDFVISIVIVVIVVAAVFKSVLNGFKGESDSYVTRGLDKREHHWHSKHNPFGGPDVYNILHTMYVNVSGIGAARASSQSWLEYKSDKANI